MTLTPRQIAALELCIAIACDGALKPKTLVGALRIVVVPSPNWPFVLVPQHCTPPPVMMTHEW